MSTLVYPQTNTARIGSRARLLWLVHRHPGISRAEIALESGLSKAAISATVADLLDKGLLLEMEMPSRSAGRRRIGLQVNHQAGMAIGIEVDAGRALVVLTDLSGKVIRSARRSFRAAAPNDAMREAAALVKALVSGEDRLVGLGISVPGLVDAAGESALVFAPQAWSGEVPFVSLLREQLDVDAPFALVNTRHAGALGEYCSGAGQAADDLIFVSAGDTIGAGFILNGELYSGSSGGAGELGHVVVDPGGPRCACGNMGCLEALAGGTAIVEEVARAWERTRSLTRESLGRLTLQDVVEAAAAGDLAALAAVREAGEYLGLAIAGLVNALNPRLVVIGGMLAETGDTLVSSARQAVLRRASPAAYSTVDITQATLGSDAAAVGAAALAIDRYLLAYS